MGEIRLNSAYKKAHETNARYRVIYGGSGSGKSVFTAQEIILNMISDKDYQYLVVRKTANSIKNSVFKLLCRIIDENDLKKFFTINKTDKAITGKNGSSLVTSGLDDVEKLKSIDGINRIWAEEASELTEKDFTQLDLRLRGLNKLGYQITLTFNPISELHWIKKKFFDVGMKNSFILKTTYQDNNFIDEDYKKTLESLMEQDYQYYRIYALGEWGSLGNLIFTNWEKQDLTEIKKTFDKYYNGQDFGFASDPLAFVRVHVDKKNKILYITDELYEVEMHNDELSLLLSDIIGKERVTCDSAEPKSIADLKRNGINAVPAKKGKDSISHGIKFIKGFKVIIDVKCINTIKEFSGYKWREDKDGNVIAKPIEFNNHIIDALRYALELESSVPEQWGWKTNE